MLFPKRWLICVGALACFALTSAAAGQEPEINARDAFWSAADLVGKRPPAASQHKASAAPQPSNPTSGQSKILRTPSRVNESGAQTVSVKAPLGLRYSVLKGRPDGTYEEVSPDAVFHAGDRIRLSIMSNQEGYLYIIEHGSSGKWQPLYPPPGSDETKVVPGQEYLIPGGEGEDFRVKGDPGPEKLFVVLSREPEADLDKTIEALRNRQENGVNEQLDAQLHSEVQSRDLVFAKADDEQGSTDAAHKDEATYVVNKASSKTADPHIVVDVVLSHK